MTGTTEIQGRADTLPTWAVGLLLTLATIGVYAAVYDYPFIDYDDPGYVFDNDQVRGGLTAEGLRWALTTGQQSNWHPLTWWSHMLDVELFGIDWPGGHHLTNLLLHVANTLLLWLLLLRATGHLWRPAFVAAIFGLHPLHVESVVWISERKDVLSTLFGLLSILAYVAYAKQHRLRWYGLSFLLLALGLLAKPMLVTLPFLLLLLDYWPLRRDEPDRNDRGWTRLISEKLPMFILVILSSSVTYLVQRQGGAVVFDQPLTHRLSTAVIGYVLYLDKLFRPVDLALLYPNHLGMWKSWQVLGSVTLLAALTAGVAWLREKRYLAVGWLWFLGTLVPVIGVVQFGRQTIADRYMYLPMVGLLIAFTWGTHELLQRVRGGRRVAAASATLVIVACLWLTPRQVGRWRDSFTLFSHALSVTERNDVMHHALGHVLYSRGDLAEAMLHFRTGLEINPNNAEGFYNLAGVLKQMGRQAEAMTEYRRALRIDPDNRDAHTNLAGALAAEGQTDEALFHYREAIRIDPNSRVAHFNVAGALITSGNVAEGVRHYREALRLDPDFVEAHTNLGITLARVGDLEGAAAHFRAVLRLRPDDETARRSMARIEALRQGRP